MEQVEAVSRIASNRIERDSNMTASPHLIGLGAGVVAAVLFASLAKNSALALMLFYLTPLPLFLAGIGWGARSALVALVTAAVLLAGVLNLQAAIGFALFLGTPGLILSYLMHLRRESPLGYAASADRTPPAAHIEWYPFGRIISWAALMAGGLVSFALFLLGGGDSETYRQSVRVVFNEDALQQLQSILGPEFGAAELELFVERFARYILPAFAAIFWLLVTIGNLWLATKIASISGQLVRPLPEFRIIEYPPFMVAGFAAALAVSFASGMIGLAGTSFLGAFACAFLLLGLAVMHSLLAASQFKTVALVLLYLGLFLTPWVGPPVTVLGLLEPFMQLRQRISNKAKPPATRSGPDF